jgi:hypothetical protein
MKDGKQTDERKLPNTQTLLRIRIIIALGFVNLKVSNIFIIVKRNSIRRTFRTGRIAVLLLLPIRNKDAMR